MLHWLEQTPSVDNCSPIFISLLNYVHLLSISGVIHMRRYWLNYNVYRYADESEMSDIPTVANIRQDLTEFQEKHAKLVLSSVKV